MNSRRARGSGLTVAGGTLIQSGNKMNPVALIVTAMMRTAWSTILLESGREFGTFTITFTCGTTTGALINMNLCAAKPFVQVNKINTSHAFKTCFLKDQTKTSKTKNAR